MRIMNKLYCFWTGDNDLTPNRIRCLETMKNSGLDVTLVTPKNLQDFLIEPLHEAYQYLSLNHKSDYLRCYFMHFYGGAYCDIKEIRDSWLSFCSILEHTPDIYAIGFAERPHWGSIRVIAKYIKDPELINELHKNCSKLIGNSGFIVKKQTPFTKEWYTNLMKLMDSKLDKLKENPSDDSVYAGITNNNPRYPIGWVEIQGAIFMPLCYKYLKHILNILPEPICINYR